MNTKKSRILMLIFAMALTMVITKENNAQDGTWEIGPRTLPVSVDVSEVLRESLLETPTPNLEATKSIVLKTKEEWEAWAKEGDVPAVAVARALAEVLSITVTQDKVGGVNVYRVTPPEIDEDHKNHLFLYIHGGAWVRNGGEAGTVEAVLIAARLKIAVISIDYRMPPKYSAPAAFNDVVEVWKELLKEQSPNSMVMGGTSAGGNITLGSVHRFKDEGLPLPGALYAGTPAVDLDMIGDSRFLNEGVDRLLVSWKHVPHDAAAMYAGEFDLKHPYVSPIYGNFENFPPSYIISGTRDLLLSDAVRVHRKLRRAGVEADLHIYEGQSHADYIYMWNSPESFEHYAELDAFLLRYLQSPKLPGSILPVETTRDIEIPKSAIY